MEQLESIELTIWNKWNQLENSVADCLLQNFCKDSVISHYKNVLFNHQNQAFKDFSSSPSLADLEEVGEKFVSLSFWRELILFNYLWLKTRILATKSIPAIIHPMRFENTQLSEADGALVRICIQNRSSIPFQWDIKLII